MKDELDVHARTTLRQLASGARRLEDVHAGNAGESARSVPARGAPEFRIKRLLPFSSAVLARMRSAASAAAASSLGARDRVRAWVPGCKTGGLAYGVAMLLREGAHESARPGAIQVFGTDDDEEALAFARSGRYPARAALGLDPDLRGRYTFDEGDTLRMAESLRESCIFAPHRLGQVAALSRMDLIVCHRIFDGVAASRRSEVVQALYSALRDDGVLLALDHRRCFPDQLFELTPEGYFRPRSTRSRALRSYVQDRTAEATHPEREGGRSQLELAPAGAPESEEPLSAIRAAFDVLRRLTEQTPRLASMQHELYQQLSSTARLVDGLLIGSSEAPAVALGGAALPPRQDDAGGDERARSDRKALDARAGAELAFLVGRGIMPELTRTFDWASTPIGAVRRWPQSLKTAASMLLGCPQPLMVWWGPELIQLYNDAAIVVLGWRHPSGLGRPAPEVWAHTWRSMGRGADAALHSGAASTHEALPILSTRDGHAEELYLTVSFSPIRDVAGRVGGVLCSCSEVTRRVLDRRWLGTLAALASATAAARASSAEEVCARAAAALGENPQDIPFALLYTLDADGRIATLAARQGVAAEALARLERVSLDAPDAPWPLKQVAESRREILVDVLPSKFEPVPGAVVQRPPERALVLPLAGPGERHIVGFLVAGINPLRPLDDEYRTFITLVASQTESALGRALAGPGPSSEDRFRALVNASSYAVYRMSPDWSEMRQLDGRGFVHDSQEPNRSWLDEYIEASDQSAVMAAIERAIATRTPFELEHRVRRADGTLGWALSRAVPLFDTDGAISEWIGAASDITARKDAEQALRESEARSVLADKAKDEFLATLGHELRTPLAAIVLYGKALRSGRVPPADRRRAVEAIVESAEAQSRLIDDLLDLSRLGVGELRLHPVPVDVAAVVRAAVDVVMPAATAKSISLELALAPGEPGVAVLDVVRFQQVLWNLLSNAIKFTPAGGHVRLKVVEQDDALEVEVSDDGEGLARDLLPRLFDRTCQADVREPRPHGGLGIGLVLSRRLVELHGGSIGARSEGPGKGAMFHFRLPRSAPRALPAASSEPARSAPPGRALSLQGVSVLLVETEPNTAAAMEMTLDRSGARVLTASSADAALALLDASDGLDTVTVLVSELGLPGTSGVALVQELAAARRARGRPPLPACAVSAHARDEDRERALEAGFDMFLAKPFAPERLIEAVDDLRQVALGSPASAELRSGHSAPSARASSAAPASGDFPRER